MDKRYHLTCHDTMTAIAYLLQQEYTAKRRKREVVASPTDPNSNKQL